MTFDELYGWAGSSIEDLAQRLGLALNITFELHESSFRGGDYYLWEDLEEDGELIVQQNLMDDGEFAEPSHPSIDRYGVDLLGADANIPDRATFVRFLVALANDLRRNPEEWVSTDLEEYLLRIGAWMSHGLEAFRRNIRHAPIPDQPSWRLIADVMTAPRVVDE